MRLYGRRLRGSGQLGQLGALRGAGGARTGIGRRGGGAADHRPGRGDAGGAAQPGAGGGRRQSRVVQRRPGADRGGAERADPRHRGRPHRRGSGGPGSDSGTRPGEGSAVDRGLCPGPRGALQGEAGRHAGQDRGIFDDERQAPRHRAAGGSGVRAGRGSLLGGQALRRPGQAVQHRRRVQPAGRAQSQRQRPGRSHRTSAARQAAGDHRPTTGGGSPNPRGPGGVRGGASGTGSGGNRGDLLVFAFPRRYHKTEGRQG